MADFAIRGRVKGHKEVARALNAAPNIFFFDLRKWLIGERRKVVGDRKRTKGYKKILGNKTRRKRGGKWTPQITGLFKGHIPFAKRMGDLSLTMGVLGKRKNQLQKAMEMQQTGGTISSSKMMPVPIYKNIMAAGFRGGYSKGKAGNIKSRAFDIMNKIQFAGGGEGGKRLVPIRVGSRVYFFDATQRKRRAGKGRGGRFLKKGLLFIGLHRIRIKRQFQGRYDLYARFNRMENAIMKRGRTAIDRATRKVERKK